MTNNFRSINEHNRSKYILDLIILNSPFHFVWNIVYYVCVTKIKILVIIYVRFKSIWCLFILLRVSIICKKGFQLLTQWEKAALFLRRTLNMLGLYDILTVFVIISQPMESCVILLLSFCLFSLSLEPTFVSSELHGGRQAKNERKVNGWNDLFEYVKQWKDTQIIRNNVVLDVKIHVEFEKKKICWNLSNIAF